MIETICGPQSLKDLLFGPLQGKFATSGMEKRAGHSGCWGGGLGRWPGTLQLCSLLDTSPHPWSFWRAPPPSLPSPGLSIWRAPLPLPSPWPLRAGPASKHVFCRRAPQPAFPPGPGQQILFQGFSQHSPHPHAQAMELCGPEPDVFPSGPWFLHVLGEWV